MKQDTCPHCGNPLKLSDVIKMMNGSGYVRHVLVELPDGRIVPMRAVEVNPNTMTVLEK